MVLSGLQNSISIPYVQLENGTSLTIALISTPMLTNLEEGITIDNIMTHT